MRGTSYLVLVLLIMNWVSSADVNIEGGEDDIDLFNEDLSNGEMVTLQDGTTVQGTSASISPDSSITASSARNIDGTVTIDSPETDISGSLAVLSGAFLKGNTLSADRCSQRGSISPSTFVVKGPSGVPISPDQPHTASTLDLVPIPQSLRPQSSSEGVNISQGYPGIYLQTVGCDS